MEWLALTLGLGDGELELVDAGVLSNLSWSSKSKGEVPRTWELAASGNHYQLGVSMASTEQIAKWQWDEVKKFQKLSVEKIHTKNVCLYFYGESTM